MAHQSVRATETQLTDALGAGTELNPVYRRLLKMALEEWQFIEQQRDQLEQEIAALLRHHEDASGWPRFLAWESILRSRSSPK